MEKRKSGEFAAFDSNKQQHLLKRAFTWLFGHFRKLICISVSTAAGIYHCMWLCMCANAYASGCKYACATKRMEAQPAGVLPSSSFSSTLAAVGAARRAVRSSIQRVCRPFYLFTYIHTYINTYVRMWGCLCRSTRTLTHVCTYVMACWHAPRRSPLFGALLCVFRDAKCK